MDSKEKNKLIIPIYYKQNLVAYQSRSLFKSIYKNTGPIKQYIYYYDYIPKNAILFIVEGVMDWISLHLFLINHRKNKNYYVTTSFSKMITTEQINLIETLIPEKVIFMLDYDAWYGYYGPSYKLNCSTDFLILPKDKDPGNMNNLNFIRLFNENNL
jgi:hypothetical protein